MNVEEARAVLENAGYVVLKEKSHRAAQERQRRAECFREAAEDRVTSVEKWARNSLDEERRLRERLTFVYGIAMAHGATTEELAGSTGERADS
jgi:hypothetical protein